MNNKNINSTVNFLTFICTILCVGFLFYGVKTGLFYSEEALREFLSNFGYYAPLFFIIIQAVQVVIPILPFAIGCLGGVLIFGPFYGFLYNYIGISIGSVIAFLIAKRYGTPVLNIFFSEKTLEKYKKYTSSNHFNTMFAMAIFFPIAPDDFLCYVAGTTNMSLSLFVAIILAAKPFTIALYSYGLNTAFRYLFMFVR